MEGAVRTYKIAVVGGEPLTLGFRLAGITESHIVESQEEAEQEIRRLLEREDIGIIAVSAKVIRSITERHLRESVESSTRPLVIDVPEYGEAAPEDTLRRLIIRAIGIDISAS